MIFASVTSKEYLSCSSFFCFMMKNAKYFAKLVLNLTKTQPRIGASLHEMIAFLLIY